MGAEEFEAVPPFVRAGPATAATPLVLAVPHAGRHYPAEIERARAVPWATLVTLEDRYADRLVQAAVAAAAVAIVATIARAWIDLNRAETEIGNETARARAGLGLVPQRIAGQRLWRAPPDPRSLAVRIGAVHRPYHAALEEALEQALAAHGFAVLLDCHSMPPLARAGGTAARIVIGDLHGASADGAVVNAAVAAAGAEGLAVARNAPYAGAFTIERHGRPRSGVHALQIEIDRTLYLDHDGREPGPAIEAVARLLAGIGSAAIVAARPPAFDVAAE